MPTISQYHTPLAKTSSAKRLGWLREARTESENFLSNQPGYTQLEDDLRTVNANWPDLFAGFHNNPQGTATNQKLYVPQSKRMLSELSAILGNIEPSWTHTPSNDELRSISDQLDMCTRVWWERTSAVERIVEAVQWSAANRSGYIFPIWNRHLRGLNQGDIELRVGGPKSYLPLWPDESNNIQEAYAGTIKVAMPITKFATTWPTLAESVYPDGEQPQPLIPRVIRGAQELFNPTDQKQYHAGRVPTVTVYWTYIKDMTMNLTQNTIPMGTPGTQWNYTVPAFGSDLPTGLIDTNTGNDLTRKTQKEDTYLYPWLRLIIWTQDVICYDGPSYWFHGRIPAVKLTLDPWPWTFLGGSLVRDIASLEEANNRTLRSVDKREQLKSKPPRQVSEELVDATTMQSLDRLMETPGAIVKVESFRDGDVIRHLYSAQDLEVSQWELAYYRSNKDEMMDVLGLNNLQRLAELRQVPGGDTQEKMLQITGARTQRKGNIMERFVGELAPMVDALILQWYDTRFRWKLFGYKGISVYDFDNDPGTLVPERLPGQELSLDFSRKLPADRRSRDSRSEMFNTRAKRAKHLCRAMGVQIERGSLLDITSMTRQLLELRLWSDPAFPKDPISLANSLKLTGMGAMDDDENVDSRIGRAKKWARLYTEEVARLQAAAQSILQGATPEAELSNAIKKIVSNAMTGNGDGHDATGNAVGRPPSYSAPPAISTRTDPGTGEQRTILSTSGD